jgi:hypothetical protein
MKVWLDAIFWSISLGKGHYYKNNNLKKQKEQQKICKQSLHQKSPLKWSLCQKSLFWKYDQTTYGIFPLWD